MNIYGFKTNKNILSICSVPGAVLGLGVGVKKKAEQACDQVGGRMIGETMPEESSGIVLAQGRL